MVGASYSIQKSRYLAGRGIGELFAFSQASDLREVPNAPTHLASIRGGVPILARALMLMNRGSGHPIVHASPTTIADENRLKTGATDWDITSAGDPDIQGIWPGVG